MISETFILSQITGLIDRGHDVEIFASPPKVPGKTHQDVDGYDLLSRTHYWPTLASTPEAGWVEAASGAGQQLGQFARKGLENAAWAATVTRRLARAGVDIAQSPELWARAVSLGGPRRFDAVISHFGHVARETQMLRDLGALEGPLVTVFHAWDVTVYLRDKGTDIYQDLFERGELLLPISEHWQNRLIELGSPAERTKVHHMGIDCAKFEFSPRTPDADGIVRLISVARFVEKKGLYYAIRALARVVEQHPNIEYHLVGDGPLRPQIEALVEELGLSENVRFLGWRTHAEVAELLDQTHILWLPSVTALSGDTEGIPMVLMEAMARGLPVLSTYHSGIPELVEDGVSGALVPERDISGMAEKLTEMLENPQSWPEMGRAGRARVEAEFNIDRLNDRLETLLKTL
ncbi:glycosyltransferase [Bradymonas sediminis]|nr:glycosyltransferase [Bradymonas sediminis]TDP73485.1 colanic acid/amylovoran biosynthesis glycosyltransferase [Bradymonas sediminis]